MSEQILSQEEVDALLQGIDGQPAAAPEGATSAQPAAGVRGVDLAGEARLVRARMPALEIIGERFARNVRKGLFDFMQKSPEVAIGPIRVQKYGDFLRDIVVPTNFNIVGIKPLRGAGLIVCDPQLVFAAIDALFGGAGRATRIEGRDFSLTEQRVITRLVDVIVAEYRKAWQGIYPLELHYQRSEMQPQFANVATPAETVVCSSFALEIGDSPAGSIHFCFPYATLEPIRDVLYSSVQGDAAAADRRWLHQLEQQIQSAEVEVVAELASATATVEQLLSFKPGDFVELDLRPAIVAKVDGVPVLECHYGTSNGRYAIRVDHIVCSPEQGWLGDHHVV